MLMKGKFMKNIEVIKSMSLRELAILLIEKVGLNYRSPSGEDFFNYYDALNDSIKWLDSEN